jgi:hypothetical protein
MSATRIDYFTKRIIRIPAMSLCFARYGKRDMCNQGESRIRVPAIVFGYPRHSGANDEGMTPRSLIFAYLVLAKKEARSKDIHEARKAQHTDLE